MYFLLLHCIKLINVLDMKKGNIKEFHIPYKGLVSYFKSFKPTGYKSGSDEVLFGFWMALYHSVCIALPLGYLLVLLVKIINI